MKKWFVSIIAVFFAGTQCLFAHSAETCFWAERKKARGRGPLNELAGLSVRSSGWGTQGNPVVVGDTSFGLPDDAIRSAPRGFTQVHGKLLRALTTRYGSIRKISFPSSPPLPTSLAPVIVHVQDVHKNLGAQKNIASLLQNLVVQSRPGLDLIALEGAFGVVDLERFRAFPEREATRDVADYLLKENKISGPIHTAFTSAVPLPPIRGVDDPVHYEANVEAYRQSAPRMADVKGVVDRQKIVLFEEKAKACSPELFALDGKVRSYQEGKSRLGDYVNTLAHTVPSLPPSVRNFCRVIKLENTLDFNKAEAERKELIQRLTARMSGAEIQNLENHSLAYRMGQIRYAGFHKYLLDLCAAKGQRFEDFQEMARYVEYVLLADGINAETLFGDLSRLEKAAYASLAKTDLERDLIARSRWTLLKSKLVDFSLTSSEWEEYLALKSLGGTRPARQVEGGPDLSSFESFYRQAEFRDRAMAENLMRAVAAIGPERQSTEGSLGRPLVCVLVTGGFHSAGVARDLTRQGCIVISWTPKIEKVVTNQGTAYLSAFGQEKTPLEKLFQKEKLFLAQNPISPFVEKLEAPALIAAAALPRLPARHTLGLLVLSTMLSLMATVQSHSGDGSQTVAVGLTNGYEYKVRWYGGKNGGYATETTLPLRQSPGPDFAPSALHGKKSSAMAIGITRAIQGTLSALRWKLTAHVGKPWERFSARGMIRSPGRGFWIGLLFWPGQAIAGTGLGDAFGVLSLTVFVLWVVVQVVALFRSIISPTALVVVNQFGSSMSSIHDNKGISPESAALEHFNDLVRDVGRLNFRERRRLGKALASLNFIQGEEWPNLLSMGYLVAMSLDDRPGLILLKAEVIPDAPEGKRLVLHPASRLLGTFSIPVPYKLQERLQDFSRPIRIDEAINDPLFEYRLEKWPEQQSDQFGRGVAENVLDLWEPIKVLNVEGLEGNLQAMKLIPMESRHDDFPGGNRELLRALMSAPLHDDNKAATLHALRTSPGLFVLSVADWGRVVFSYAQSRGPIFHQLAEILGGDQHFRVKALEIRMGRLTEAVERAKHITPGSLSRNSRIAYVEARGAEREIEFLSMVAKILEGNRGKAGRKVVMTTHLTKGQMMSLVEKTSLVRVPSHKGYNEILLESLVKGQLILNSVKGNEPMTVKEVFKRNGLHFNSEGFLVFTANPWLVDLSGMDNTARFIIWTLTGRALEVSATHWKQLMDRKNRLLSSA